MNTAVKERDGGHILIDELLIQGVDTAFCVPGESFLAAINAFYDRQDELTLVVCRQEGGAAFMAETYGKLTNKPGVCFVTRGPGATNASIGVHTAFQDSTPMVLFIGQVGTDFIDREAFQEIDFRRMFGQMCKWVAQIDRTDRIPEYVSRAFQIAVSGRPGPCVLSIPEDVLSRRAVVSNCTKYKSIKASPSINTMQEFFLTLRSSRNPLFLVGGSGWTDEACKKLIGFAEKNSIPLACSFRRQDLVNNNHPNYCGEIGISPNPELLKNIRNSDFICALGPRLGEMTTNGYSLFDPGFRIGNLVHVHQGVEELGKVYKADLMINSGMEQFCEAMMTYNLKPLTEWHNWRKKLRDDYLAYVSISSIDDKYVDLGLFMDKLKDVAPKDSIITNGAGNYSGWVQRYWRYSGRGTQLAPTNGAMGYGVPSGIAASILHPEKTIISFSGDGCFLMNGQELSTAVQQGVKVLFIVVNNGMYGTIRLHQERAYPKRTHATGLNNPNFAKLAESYGLQGFQISSNENIDEILEKAIFCPLSSLIELKVNPDRITHKMVLPLSG